MRDTLHPILGLLPESPERVCARNRVDLGVDSRIQGVRCRESEGKDGNKRGWRI